MQTSVRMKKTTLFLLPLIAAALATAAHGATAITSLTLTPAPTSPPTLNANVQYDLATITVGTTVYVAVEGGTATGTTVGSSASANFIFGNFTTVVPQYDRTVANKNAALSGLDMSLYVANATDNGGLPNWTFTTTLDQFDGFAFFESDNGDGDTNEVPSFQLYDAFNVLVGQGSFSAYQDNLISGPGGSFRRKGTDSSTGTDVSTVSVQISGVFFTLADFTQETGQDISTATQIRLTGASGIDPGALIAVNIPEPSALLLGALGLLPLLRRKR